MRDLDVADGGQGHHHHRSEVTEVVDVGGVEEFEEAGLQSEALNEQVDDVFEGIVIEEEFGLSWKVEDKEKVVCLQLLQLQLLDCLGVSPYRS
jgi:hypothetical protein